MYIYIYIYIRIYIYIYIYIFIYYQEGGNGGVSKAFVPKDRRARVASLVTAIA